MKSQITINDYDHLLMHVAERFIEFRIIYNHAKLTHNEKFKELHEINADIIAALYRHRFNDDDIKKLKVVSEFWDSVQSNFAFDKIINPSILSPREKELYDGLNTLIYKLKRHPDFVNKIKKLKDGFYHLNRLRIADVINAVTPEQFLQRIGASKGYLLKFKTNRKFKNYGQEPLTTLLNIEGLKISPFCEALSFYPELLRPGVQYIYPYSDEMPAKTVLAISCRFDADKDDIQDATEEYPYQFEKFINYYHHDASDLLELVEIERLRPLLQRNTSNNKYIKRQASIESTLLALICWEKMQFEKMDKDKAIKSVFPDGYNKNDRTELLKKLDFVYEAMDKLDAKYNVKNSLNPSKS